MKIKEGFVLREVLGRRIVAATGEAAKNFNGMLKLNGTAADIWQWVAEGCDREALVVKLTETYEIDAETARRDVDAVCGEMIKNGIWEP